MAAMNLASNHSTGPRDSLVELDEHGRFKRTPSGFREIISKDHPIFKPEPDRYHLYVSLACPWASRCVAMRSLKSLGSVIGMTVVHPTWQKTRPHDDNDNHYGWAFFDPSHDKGFASRGSSGPFVPQHHCTADPINRCKTIRELYELSHDTTGKYTVPILWDKKTSKIVNNESSEILRMLNHEFNEWASGPWKDYDFCREDLRSEIDEANSWIYPGINDGVYRCGFAKTQFAYEEAFDSLYLALNRLEDLLSYQRYVVNSHHITESDIRLFVTLIRFDEVYTVYFKCNGKRIVDYHNILNYCRDMFQLPGMAETVDMEHIKMHYFTSHPTLNTYSIIPKGNHFVSELVKPHDRDRFKNL